METNMQDQYKQDLINRLGNVIQSRCNTIGCKNCDLKWGDECSATELQGKIDDIEFAEMNHAN